MNKKIILVSMLLAIMVIFLFVTLKPYVLPTLMLKNKKVMMGMFREDKNMGQMGERFAAALKLTSEQKVVFLRKKDEMQTESGKYQQNIKKLQKKIHAEFKKDAPSKDVIYRYMDEISRNKILVQKKRVSFILDVYSELAPDQKKAFKNLFGQGE